MIEFFSQALRFRNPPILQGNERKEKSLQTLRFQLRMYSEKSEFFGVHGQPNFWSAWTTKFLKRQDN